MRPATRKTTLNDREREVLALVALGYSHKEIGEQLYTTRRGITAIVSRTMMKLGALNAPHAVLLACQAGLIDGRPKRHRNRTPAKETA